MDTLASEVKQQADAIAARTGVLPAAVVGFSDYVYRDAFDNWINAARNVAFSVPAFVALDNRTAAHFDGANVPVVIGLDSRADSAIGSAKLMAHQTQARPSLPSPFLLPLALALALALALLATRRRRQLARSRAFLQRLRLLHAGAW